MPALEAQDLKSLVLYQYINIQYILFLIFQRLGAYCCQEAMLPTEKPLQSILNDYLTPVITDHHMFHPLGITCLQFHKKEEISYLCPLINKRKKKYNILYMTFWEMELNKYQVGALNSCEDNAFFSIFDFIPFERLCYQAERRQRQSDPP